MANPYRSHVAAYARLLEKGKGIRLGGLTPPRKPRIKARAPKVLIFSPHPDDECIIGAIALRLLREEKMNVINVAVTQGSKKERQAARLAELTDACNYLGFGLVATKEGGLEQINLKGRAQDPANWESAVDIIAAILRENAPKVILVPHEADWNSSHIGTNALVMDALKKIGPGLSCYVVETEFWGAMANPNLMIESSVKDLGDMLAALSFHVGEVQRNPYHLLQPAWMEDNVRRGGELVGGQGGAAPDFKFATLYRLRLWTGTELQRMYEGGRIVSATDPLGPLFP
jgi:N-acetylglucosamine malate deacetylase 1